MAPGANPLTMPRMVNAKDRIEAAPLTIRGMVNAEGAPRDANATHERIRRGSAGLIISGRLLLHCNKLEQTPLSL